MFWAHEILRRAYPNKASTVTRELWEFRPEGLKIGLLLKPFSFRELPQMAVVASIHGTPQSNRKTGPVRVFSGLVIFQQALICRALLNFPLGSGLLDYTDSALTINTEPWPFVWRLRDPSRSQLMSLRSCPVCPTEHSKLEETSA